MFTLKKTIAAAGAMVLLSVAGAQAQEDAAGLGHAILSLDGSASADAGIAAATGWHVCSVVRTGAGWGNHYVALTCPNGPFTNKWHVMSAGQKDAMLATALAAASSDNDVQVYIQSAAGAYNQISALYLHK